MPSIAKIIQRWSSHKTARSLVSCLILVNRADIQTLHISVNCLTPGPIQWPHHFSISDSKYVCKLLPNLSESPEQLILLHVRILIIMD